MGLDSTPPPWSLAVGTLGSWFVYFAAGLLVLSATLWVLSPKRALLAKLGGWSFTLGILSILGALVSLGVLFARNRFEFDYVYRHADARDPILYRIAGIWAGQQGSFLLWACSAAVFGLVAVRGTGHYRRWFTASYAIFLAAIAGILAYETPFALNMVDGRPVALPNGLGLVPALQNYWVIIHPPTIFLGFGSLTVMACLAVAAMLTGDKDRWLAITRPWTLVSVALLGLGLCMGGFWAYETLGWGGFWMWDPVENTSFVPWCFAAALVHGTMVQTAKGKWKNTNLLLAGLPFLSFVYGTFLTRSGLLSEASVHSFAQMDRTAHKVLLGFFIVSVVGFLAFWVRSVLKDSPPEEARSSQGAHREAVMRYGVLLLSAFALATAIGMSVPMFQALAGKAPKVVEEGLYHLVLSWFFVPLMAIMGIAPYLSWTGRSAKDTFVRIMNTASVSFALTGVAMFLLRMPAFAGSIDPSATVAMPFGGRAPMFVWIAFLLWLCFFSAIGNLWRMIEVGRALRTTGGGLLSHLGVAVLVVGLIISRGLERKVDLRVQEGRPAAAMEYVVAYADIPVSSETYWNRLFDKHNKIAFHVVGEPIGAEQEMKPGETTRIGSLTLKYERPFRDGEPGVLGTRFGAVIQTQGRSRKQTARPSVEIGPAGLIQHSAALNDDTILVPTSMDAATQTLKFQLFQGYVATPGHYLSIAPDGRTNPMVWPHIKRAIGHDVYFTLHPQVLEASEPLSFSVGETKSVNEMSITYNGLLRDGAAGAMGTKFAADLTLEMDGGKISAQPSLAMTEEGMEPEFVPAGHDYMVRMIGLDANTKAATVQLFFTKPVYPIEFFIKPWTGLVWLGTGILTVGGLWAAWSRRPKRPRLTELSEPEAPYSEPDEAHAPLQTTEV